MEGLTDIQRKLLGLYLLRWERGEPAPSLREICMHFGYASTRAAADHIAALKRKNYLADDPGNKRGCRLTDQAIGVPVLGVIPAGIPIQAEECIESRLTFNTRPFGIADRSKAFFLRVSGDSMIGRQIFDGDLVLLEQSNVFGNEDIVAALIDNESTLKTFVQEEGRPWLRSENPKYPALIPAWDLQIQGVARGVIRLFDHPS